MSEKKFPPRIYMSKEFDAFWTESVGNPHYVYISYKEHEHILIRHLIDKEKENKRLREALKIYENGGVFSGGVAKEALKGGK